MKRASKILICSALCACCLLAVVAKASVLVLDEPRALSAFVAGRYAIEDKRDISSRPVANKSPAIYMSAQVSNPGTTQVLPLRGGELPSAMALVLEMQRGI